MLNSNYIYYALQKRYGDGHWETETIFEDEKEAKEELDWIRKYYSKEDSRRYRVIKCNGKVVYERK